MNLQPLLRSVLGTFVLGGAVLASGAFAQDAAYTFTGEGLTGPETLPAGFHTFSLTNETENETDFVILQLANEAAGANLVEEVGAIDSAFMGEGDPAAAFRTVLEGRTLWGGPTANPGEAASVGVELPAGRYVLLGSRYSEAGPTSYATHPLEVTVDEGAAPPTPDATVQLVDFAFALPADLAAGTQTWEVVNRGKQVHHVVLQKLKAGKTMDDVMAFAETFEGEDPTEAFAYVNMLSSGSSNFVELELTPGTYVALCFIPDYAEGGDGAPHMAHGMMQSFTVAGN